MAKIPDFTKLWAAYPNGEAEDVKKFIGGAVDAAWITNTCTIRMSRAFNYSGVKIPGNYPGLTTVKGKDGLRYAFRVLEFRKYMYAVYGKPNIHIIQPAGSPMPAAFAGKKGIVNFNDCGWSDATGHFDLWDGTNCAHEGYWDRAKEVNLWVATGTWQVAGATTLAQGGTPIVTLGRQ